MYLRSVFVVSILTLLGLFLVASCTDNSIGSSPEITAPGETATPSPDDGVPAPMLFGSEADIFLDQNQNLPDGSDERSHAEASASYPNYSFCLNVPFMPQVLPGTWSGTKNCGQAVGAMLGGAFNNGTVAPWVITEENKYLAGITGDSRYRDANGWYTGGSRLWAYRKMLWDFHRVNTRVYYGNRADDVVCEVARGHPVIVGVMIKSGRLVSSGGSAHWALAVGWNGYIYLHDPGTTSGRYIRYSVAQFEASWATQGKIYMPCSR